MQPPALEDPKNEGECCGEEPGVGVMGSLGKNIHLFDSGQHDCSGCK